MRKGGILVSPGAQSLENFHSEVRKTMKQTSQALSQDEQHPQINIDSMPKNKGAPSSQQKSSQFHLSHILLDNTVSTQIHQRQLQGE